MWFNLFLLCFVTTAINSIDINEIDLALEHMPYYLHQFSNIGKACKQDPKCLYADHVDRNASWGYERVERDPSRLYHVKPTCPGDHRGWVKTKKAQYETFYTQADFGKFPFYFTVVTNTYYMCGRVKGFVNFLYVLYLCISGENDLYTILYTYLYKFYLGCTTSESWKTRLSSIMYYRWWSPNTFDKLGSL